jgi:hypothetical protein
MTTFRPFSLEATTPRRRKCYPMLIIYHVARIITILATFAIVAACLMMMG